MKSTITTIIFCLFIYSNLANGQELEYYQYFDGADTVENASIFIELNNSDLNIWQIGKPQKSIFNAAETLPNALLTDTINYIPTNNVSSFQYTITPYSNWGILAIQWKQKLDMDFGKDGGLIEFSVDGGNTWQSAFNNPYVYSFYGYDASNVDTLESGEQVFTGTDDTWKDIWLCYDLTWLTENYDIIIRHTMISDAIDNNNEGWMIDNLLSHFTVVHTVAEVEQKDYLKVSPNPTTGRIEISTKKLNEYHIIEHMELLDASGNILNKWKFIPTKFFIDISNYANGLYYLKIKTNKKSELVKVMLQK